MKQSERIMRHLQEYGSITQAEAMEEYGIYRLASRISDLRKNGVSIRRTMEKGRNRYNEPIAYARYRLEE